MFSTTNPEKRYIHMKNVKGSNNLRSMYIRSITLGGQDEVIYDGTDSLEIARAFRKAGRSMQNHWKSAVVVVVEGYSNMASIGAMLKEYFSSAKRVRCHHQR